MGLCALCRSMVESALYAIAWLAFYGYFAVVAVLGLRETNSAYAE